MTKQIRGDWFVTRKLGIWVASPLFMVLLVVESSDLVFAMDSIPAIFAITLDPFIVLTSNIFAIMGLRSLFSCSQI
jgi:tellurite resistance protein TerC